jgi:hypothetical protein
MKQTALPAPTSVSVAKSAKTNTATPLAEKKPRTSATPRASNHSVKVITEPVLEGGVLWKMSGKNGVAYVKDAVIAGELLATEPKNLAKRAMAVYYDKKGKAFAWQVRFDTDRWEEVMRRLG